MILIKLLVIPLWLHYGIYKRQLKVIIHEFKI
jgi:hypothetical protein